MLSSADYSALIVAYRNGAPVKLTDVANVVDDIENVRQAAWMNQTPAVIVNIQRQPGANIISVVDRIKKLLPQLTATLPPVGPRRHPDGPHQHHSRFGGRRRIRTDADRRAGGDGDLSCFCATSPATIIPSVAVPLSLVGTFGVMYLLGYSLNNLTLMALTISTGFVVDDAIVMIENITPLHRGGREAARRRAERLRADRLHDHLADDLADRRADSAAVHGRHRGPAVPRIRGDAQRDDSGVRGRLADADADDGAKLLKHTPESKQGRFFAPPRHAFERDHRVLWPDAASWSCAIRPSRCWWRSATLALTVFLFIDHPQGILPDSGHRRDPGRFGSGADRLVPGNVGPAAAALAKMILKDPAVESLSSFIGIDGTNTTLNSGRILINLKPLDERKISATDVIRRLQPKLANDRRHHAVHAAGAGPHGGRSRQPHAVPVHARRSQRRRAEHLRAAACWRS